MTKSQEVKLMTVTPEVAREWLESNLDNRPIKESVIRRYAEAMKAGQWEINGESIKFSIKGVLLDGQHRLRAIINSGITVQTYVVMGLPGAVFDTIDTGVVRTASDLLALEGEDNHNVLSPCLRLLYIEDELGSIREMNSKLAKIITNRDILETLDRHGQVRQSLAFVTGVVGLSKLLSVPLLTFLHYKFTKLNAPNADTFFIKLARAIDLEEEDPIYLLRSRLNNMNKASTAGRIEAVALAIKAWNHYRTKEPIKQLRWLISEDYPIAE